MSIKTRILILGFLATFFLSCAVGFVLWSEYRDKANKQALLSGMEKVERLSALINELQRERGVSAGYLSAATDFARTRLQSQQADTQQALRRLRAGDSENIEALRELASTQEKVAERQMSLTDSFAWYSLAIVEILDQIEGLEKNANLPALKRDLHAHLHLLNAKEHLGQIRASLTEFLARKDQAPTHGLARQVGLHRYHARSFQQDASPALQESYRATSESPAMKSAFAVVDAVLRCEPVDRAADQWFSTATSAIDDLGQIENQSLTDLRQRVAEEIRLSEARLWWVSLTAVFVSLICLSFVATSVHRLVFAFGRLVASIRQTISTSDFAHRITPAGDDEVSDIARNFNELLEIAEGLIEEKDRLASTDALTGALNRRKFPELFSHELRNQSEYAGTTTCLSMIMFDIDHFKQINDGLGHAAGDAVLKEVAGLVKSLIRKTDVLARWGGEEFMILVPNVGLETASQLAEKLRLAIEKHAFAESIKVTVSFGVSEYHAEDTLETICQRADEALYAAKSQGRNRVCLERIDPLK
ncbi:MAG: putative diguanylate cyclase YdaM [Betaproteobacteria bacterium ADurb.Bin341]|nr:MAG: putative diguanylate cyclase YdaM [Betaproteobacteria bacterium ADurb.Bin341]